MSKHSIEFDVPLSLSNTTLACREAISECGWKVLKQTETHFVCKEVMPQSTSFTNPSQVEIILQGKSNDTTKVIVNGSILGFGFIQSGHIKGQVGNIQNKIELCARKIASMKDEPTSYSLTAELEKLHKLKEQGIISEDDFQQAKLKLIR